MNFLEQLTAEWFTLQGYFVQTNLKYGKLPKGGWVGEMDVIAFHPQKKELASLYETDVALIQKLSVEQLDESELMTDAIAMKEST